MLSFQLTELSLSEKKIEVKNLCNLDDSLMTNFLDYYEKRVYRHLKEKQLLFKYIQGTLKSSFFKTSLERFSTDLQTNYNVYNLTQHPNFVGSIVINHFINYCSLTKNYVVTYENPIAENWLNSKVSYLDVINNFKKLNTNTIIKRDIKIIFIRIFNSDLIIFNQINKGSSKPLFKLQDNAKKNC